LKIIGVASGFAFGYDPTGRSVLFKNDQNSLNIQYSIENIQ